MEILGFLFGLGCLILTAWMSALVAGAVFSGKRRQQKLPHLR